MFAPLVKLPDAVIARRLPEMKDRLYVVPALQTTLTVEFADSVPRIVDRLPKFTVVAETEQALTIVTCTLNVPEAVAANAEEALARPAVAMSGRRYLRMTLPLFVKIYFAPWDFNRCRRKKLTECPRVFPTSPLVPAS